MWAPTSETMRKGPTGYIIFTKQLLVVVVFVSGSAVAQVNLVEDLAGTGLVTKWGGEGSVFLPPPWAGFLGYTCPRVCTTCSIGSDCNYFCV